MAALHGSIKNLEQPPPSAPTRSHIPLYFITCNYALLVSLSLFDPCSLFFFTTTPLFLSPASSLPLSLIRSAGFLFLLALYFIKLETAMARC